MKILAISDVELSFIYSPIVAQRFNDAEMVISCGDLPYYYLEYVITMLNVPLYYVFGNHQNRPEIHASEDRLVPWGAIRLHRRTMRGPGNVLLAGIDGSLQYNFGPYQYSQAEMWGMVLGLVPGLLVNRLRFGRFLDVFVTHAPPWKIHDMDDRPHMGIKAFAWFDRVFQPALHLHGHIHLYRQDAITETLLGKTRIINTFGYKELQIQVPGAGQRVGVTPGAGTRVKEYEDGRSKKTT